MAYPSNSESVAQDQIQSFFDRWRRLEDDKKVISDDLKELFAEAKGNGFDTKVMRKVFRDKVGDEAERRAFEAVYDLYWSAIDEHAEPVARDARVRTREIIEEFDPETGEITEPADPAAASDRGIAPARNEAPVATESTAALTEVRDNSTEDGTGQPLLDPAAATTPPSGNQAPPVDTIQEPLELSHADPQRSGAATRKDAGTGAPEPKPAPFKSSAQQAMDDALARQQQAKADGGLVGAAAAREGSVKIADHKAELRAYRESIGCKNPDKCGSAHWKDRCHTCDVAWKATHEVAA